MIFHLKAIEQHTGVKITGATHVGAFLGEELSQYRALGLTNTILFEPQKKLFDIVNSMNSKNSYGGTATKNVRKMIKKYRNELK